MAGRGQAPHRAARRTPTASRRVTVDGATVGEVFNALVERYPGLRGNLLDDAGGLHKFVNVYKDDDDIRYLDGLDTKLADGDVLSILPAVAGGVTREARRPSSG